MFLWLTDKEKAIPVALMSVAFIIYSFASGRAFLMPFSAKRKDSPAGFYVIMAFMVYALGWSIWTLFLK